MLLDQTDSEFQVALPQALNEDELVNSSIDLAASLLLIMHFAASRLAFRAGKVCPGLKDL